MNNLKFYDRNKKRKVSYRKKDWIKLGLGNSYLVYSQNNFLEENGLVLINRIKLDILTKIKDQ
jgi:hypothetical protein